jgi:hypothetical protein
MQLYCLFCSETFDSHICAYSVHREESNGNGFGRKLEEKLFYLAHPQIFNKSGQWNEPSAKKLMNCSSGFFDETNIQKKIQN